MPLLLEARCGLETKRYIPVITVDTLRLPPPSTVALLMDGAQADSGSVSWSSDGGASDGGLGFRGTRHSRYLSALAVPMKAAKRSFLKVTTATSY